MKLIHIIFLFFFPSFSLGQHLHLDPGSIRVDSSSIHRQERFDMKDLTVPIALIYSGVAINGNHSESLKNQLMKERNKHFPKFRTYVDDYLQFSPIVAAYGLDAMGYPSKTDLGNRTLILIKGEMAMFGITQLMKRTLRQRRPDGSNMHSFPSGHTAQAFASATFLCQEYQHRFRWMPYLAYGAASGVGAMRIVNNKHFISDVLVGAAIGILSMKASYWTHRYLTRSRANY